mmetsp:Transcript_236/g.442  ORF Transcript_236/g.442 Transcript_236/m.442 type:complete len:102 (+) Transcript_236:231-536(+)
MPRFDALDGIGGATPLTIEYLEEIAELLIRRRCKGLIYEQVLWSQTWSVLECCHSTEVRAGRVGSNFGLFAKKVSVRRADHNSIFMIFRGPDLGLNMLNDS